MRPPLPDRDADVALHCSIGMISAAELRSILTNMGDKLSDEQVQQMMGEALSSEEGNLNYRDFVHMMMNR